MKINKKSNLENYVGYFESEKYDVRVLGKFNFKSQFSVFRQLLKKTFFFNTNLNPEIFNLPSSLNLDCTAK